MRNLFRGSALLVAGMILGGLLTVGGAAQQPRDAGVRLNGVVNCRLTAAEAG